jgi:hypothetical protein
MKKSVLILSAFLMMTGMLTAQSLCRPSYNDYNYQKSWNYYFNKYRFMTSGIMNLVYLSQADQDKELKSKQIKTYTFKKGTRSATPQSATSFRFQNGLISNFQSSKKGNPRYKYIFDYNEDGYLVQFRHLAKGKKRSFEKMTYNDSNRITEILVFGKNDKAKLKKTYSYNEQGKITGIATYYKDNSIPKTAFRYTYYPDGNIKKTEFFRKGKLKTVWNHTCDEAGKREDKNVTSKNMCIITENRNDGSYVKVYRTTDEKGRISEQRRIYNKDSLMIEYEDINRKGKSIRKYQYEYDNKGRQTKFTRFDKKGSVKFIATKKYDANGNITENKSINGKGKIISFTQWKFDAQNQRTEFILYNKNEQPVKRVQLSHNARGFLIKETEFNKKNIPVREVEYTYEYL